eukprot:g8413.t1
MIFTATLPVKYKHMLPKQCLHPKLIYKPIDSINGVVNTPYLVVDTAGEYIVSCYEQGNVVLRKYIALLFGKPGERATSIEYVSESFKDDKVSTDRRYNFWHFVTDEKQVFRVSPPSDAHGVVNGRSNFFLEPLEYTFNGIIPSVGMNFFIKPSSVSNEKEYAYFENDDEASNNINLFVNPSLAEISLYSLGNELYRESYGDGVDESCIKNEKSLNEITIILKLNAKNFSLTWHCGEAKTAAVISTQHKAEGTHDINFRSNFGSNGQASTQLWLNWEGHSNNKLFKIKSLLLPGNDPLRPALPHSLPQPFAMPAVESDEVGGFGALDLPLGEEQPMASIGFLDVTAPPFFADKSGTTDSTISIQHAVDFARWHYLAVFLPHGTYRISDTIIARQTTRMMLTGDIPGEKSRGFTRDFLLDGVSSRYVAHHIRGEVTPQNERAVLYVPAYTKGFTNVSQPKICVDMRYINPIGQEEPNAQYNTNIIGIKVQIGAGNAGAVGIRLRAAQGSGIEDVEIIFEGGVDPNAGLAGIVGGCGSGGAHHSIFISGGRYGMDLRMTQPASTISGIVLSNQSCSAIIYEGFETLVAVGLNISNFYGRNAIIAGFRPNVPLHGSCYIPVMNGNYQKTNGIIAGRVSLIDSTIAFAKQTAEDYLNIAITTNRSLFMKNVFVFGASKITKFNNKNKNNKDGNERKKDAISTKWTHVKLFAHGENSSGYPQHLEWILRSPTYINGKRFKTADDIVHQIEYNISTFPPSSLITKHVWGKASEFPSPIGRNVINVRLSPYNAVGDGIEDDTNAIQQAIDDAANMVRVVPGTLDSSSCQVVLLPRGIYAIRKSLKIHNGVALIGIAKHLSRIVMYFDDKLADLERRPLFSDNESIITDTPMLETAETAEFVVLAFLSITVWNTAPAVSAIQWKSKGGIVRGIHFNRANRCGSYDGKGCKDPVQINHPMMTISGENTSLKYYTFFLEDCCRTETFPPWTTFWKGYLAGPQRAQYRHLLVTNGAGPVSFYHLNCEHGTGEAICEFSNGSHDINIYGFKSEGGTVGLWARDCANFSLFGTGGCGCVANNTRWPSTFEQDFPTYYRIQRSKNVLLANIMDQGSRLTKPQNNPFNEIGCNPDSENKILVEDFNGEKMVTDVFDRPVVLIST